MSNIAYTDEAAFEKKFPHRDASADPGSTQFTEWIAAYALQINNVLQVESDVCAVADASHTSETIKSVINTLLEEHFKFYDNYKKTPLSERGELIEPHIRQAKFVHLVIELENLKGMIPTVSASDPCAFNFDLDTLEGGFQD